MLVLDTNILIAHFGGETAVTEKIYFWRKQNITLAISTITECEVFSYPRMTAAEEERIKTFLRENFVIFPFDSPVAFRAGQIRQAFSRLKLPDAAIAALTLDKNASLVTRNIRDFQKIPNLSIFTL